MIRPGSLRAGAPAALTRGQRAHVALLYGLGEHPQRLAIAYDVPVSRIEKIAAQHQVAHGESAGPSLRRYVEAVERLADALVPLPDQHRRVADEARRLFQEGAKTGYGAALGLEFYRSAREEVVREKVADLDLPVDRMTVWLRDGMLPVAVTLYALAGLSLREVNRIYWQPLDVGGLLVLAALRGHVV